MPGMVRRTSGMKRPAIVQLNLKPMSQMPLRTLYERFSDHGKTGRFVRTHRSYESL